MKLDGDANKIMIGTLCLLNKGKTPDFKTSSTSRDFNNREFKFLRDFKGLHETS